MPPAEPKRWRNARAWDDIMLTSLRDSWVHKLGTRKLKVVTRPLENGQVRHELMGLWTCIAYTDHPSGHRVPANRHLKALTEAPYWVDRLGEACLALSSSRWADHRHTALPLAQLEARYSALARSAAQAKIKSVWNFPGHTGDAQVVEPDTQEVLWSYALPNPAWYTLWQCSYNLHDLIEAYRVRQEECFQELLGA